MTCSGASYSVCIHDSDMAIGGELRALAERWLEDGTEGASKEER